MKGLFTSSFVVLIMLMLYTSCKKETTPNTAGTYDCTFEQNDTSMDGIIDETEQSIMQDCYQNRLLTKSEIEANLVGEWELVGHGEGWVSTVSQPCGYMTITEDNLRFEFRDGSVDELQNYSWEVEETNSSNGVRHILTTTPDPMYGLVMNTFCANYMYVNATPRDGNMYLYQKVE